MYNNGILSRILFYLSALGATILHTKVVDGSQLATPSPVSVEARTVPYGSPAYIVCRTGLENPITYSWSWQGGHLPKDAIVNEGTVTIPIVQPSHAGIYVCTAENNVGKIDDLKALVVNNVVPRFDQTPISFMSLPTLASSYLQFSIEISFKPESPDGLIIYNGQQSGGSGDFISFGLSGGYAEFRFDVGSGPLIIRSPKPIALDQWHTVKLNRNRRQGSMYVNGAGPYSGKAPGRFQGLDLEHPLYIGGVPDFSKIHHLAGFSQGFIGCISRLEVGIREYELVRDATSKEGVKSCDNCATEHGLHCSYNGICQEASTASGFVCICTPGFCGKYCELIDTICDSHKRCQNNGTCISSSPSSYYHPCSFGYIGNNCDHRNSMGDPRLEVWPADGDRGAVLYVYNIKKVNDMHLKCTVQPGYATSLRKRDGFIKYSDDALQGDLYKMTYDIDFENEGKMTCSLSELEQFLISNTLTAQLLCGETFVAGFHHTYVKNITKMVNRYKKDFHIGNVTYYNQKNEGDLMITHITLSNAMDCYLSWNDSLPAYLKERNIELVYWRSTQYCDGIVGEGFSWPRTPIGTSTIPDNPCEDKDEAPGPIRRCLGDVITGAYWDEEPEDKKCRKLSDRAERTLRIENITVDRKTIGKLLEMVTEGPPLSAYEVMLVSRKLKSVKEILGDNSLGSNQTILNVTAVVKIVDTVLEAGDETLRKVEDISSSTSDIMEALDHILIASAKSVPAVTYGSHLSTFAVDEKAGVRGVLSMKEDSHSSQGAIHEITWKEDLAHLNFTQSFWGFLLMGGSELGIASSIYNSSGLFDDGNPQRKRISPVIDLKVFNKNKTTVDLKAFVLLMFPKDKEYTEEKYLCSHWNKHEGRGKWSQEGCIRTSNEIVPDNMQGCICTHFANFAMLIAHGDPFDDPALQLISKVGCSASFISIIIAFLFSAINPKRFQTVYGKIELNLFLSIFLLDAIQLIALFSQVVAGGAICIAIGVILHYSVLATFTWMMLVGLMHMLRLSPKTLLSARNMAGNHLLLKATIFGWGVAAIPVIATVSDGTHHYISDFPINICYPHGLALNWAVIFPVGIAIFINSSIFVWIAAMLLCPQGVRLQGKSWTRQTMRRISFLLFLFCLLGLYWIFGLLIEATNGHKTVQKILKYMFCVIAPLHGLLLFVFLVLCARGVRSKFHEFWLTLSQLSRKFFCKITHTAPPKETERSVDGPSFIY